MELTQTLFMCSLVVSSIDFDEDETIHSVYHESHTFELQIKGFDTHSNVDETLSNLFVQVNEAFLSFESELKAMDLWDNVTTIQVSDFARTLKPNGGDGTDHAWGGNYMMFGECMVGLYSWISKHYCLITIVESSN